MQNNVINNNDIYFLITTVSTRIEYQMDPGVKDLKVQAERDLTLSGIRHVKISGQALDLVSYSDFGRCHFYSGGLTIPDGEGLTGDNITHLEMTLL